MVSTSLSYMSDVDNETGSPSESDPESLLLSDSLFSSSKRDSKRLEDFNFSNSSSLIYLLSIQFRYFLNGRSFGIATGIPLKRKVLQ